jgi:hypothetical protein
VVENQSSEETCCISDVVELVVPDVSQQPDCERNFVRIFPIQFPNNFENLFGVVLAQIGVEQFDDELFKWRPLGLRLLLQVWRVNAIVRVLDHHDVPEKVKNCKKLSKKKIAAKNPWLCRFDFTQFH